MENSRLLTNILLIFNRLRDISHRGIKHKLPALQVLTLTLAATICCTNHNVAHLNTSQDKLGVKLKVVEITPESATISLRNDTNQSIYVSYTIPPQTNLASFLSNSLEKKNDGGEDFEPIGPTPHFGPPPLPISSGQEILFKPFFLPEKKGKYRVKIVYLDDPEIYKLVIDKSPNLTDDELQKVLPSWKPAWSDIFEIKE